ncbi:MAG: ATP-binding cassette domain-containing protein [Jatrophihabitantaceae bacterium]
MVIAVDDRSVTVVRGRALTKSFRRDAEIVNALRGVDIIVESGEILGISGASGSGKSTLLAVLCGWETPDTGELVHAGGIAADLPWSELALVPQTLGLLEDLPIRENILLPARLIKQSDDHAERAHSLMTRLGIDHLAERFPDQVSLGERQRTSIARALLLRPRLLLADEPTAHQDHGWAEVVLACLREHAADGGSCVLVSHHTHALDHADRRLSMSDGTLG